MAYSFITSVVTPESIPDISDMPIGLTATELKDGLDKGTFSEAKVVEYLYSTRIYKNNVDKVPTRYPSMCLFAELIVDTKDMPRGKKGGLSTRAMDDAVGDYITHRKAHRMLPAQWGEAQVQRADPKVGRRTGDPERNTQGRIQRAARIEAGMGNDQPVQMNTMASAQAPQAQAQDNSSITMLTAALTHLVQAQREQGERIDRLIAERNGEVPGEKPVADNVPTYVSFHGWGRVPLFKNARH